MNETTSKSTTIKNESSFASTKSDSKASEITTAPTSMSTSMKVEPTSGLTMSSSKTSNTTAIGDCHFFIPSVLFYTIDIYNNMDETVSLTSN